MLISILIFIFTILVLVLIHEFGHFIMAKKFGIKVEEFGFGIPPKIWGKKIGETLFSLNLIPLGGFVRLLGEDELDRKVLGNSRSFAAKKPWQKIMVVAAGVSMNLLLAVMIFYMVIIAQNFKIVMPAIDQGVYIGKLENGLPAQKSGIKVGERLLTIDGQQIFTIDEARNLIKSKGEIKLDLLLQDADGNKRMISVTPAKVDQDILLGIYFTPYFIKEYKSFPEKFFSGITYTYDLGKLTFLGLGRTLSDVLAGNFGKLSAQVAGPVGMAGITNDILSLGVRSAVPYLSFVGIISLTLAIFNVLPIPALDGGRLFFILIEAVFRKKIRAEVEKIIHTVGFAILLTLALLVTYSDISKFAR